MNSNPIGHQNLKAYFYLLFATLFWAGNFTIGKFASIESIPPYTLSFLRWLLVWLILFPFTFAYPSAANPPACSCKTAT